MMSGLFQRNDAFSADLKHPRGPQVYAYGFERPSAVQQRRGLGVLNVWWR